MTVDPETKSLDLQILAFIKKYSTGSSDTKSFEALAFKTFNYQFRRNQNYKKFCLLEGKRPETLKSWKDIPAMPAAGFKELVLSTFPVKSAVKVFKTSGTSGREASAIKASADAPLRGAHFFDSLKLYETAILPPFKKYLLAGEKDFLFCFLISSPKGSPHSSLSYMMGVVNRVFAKGKGKFYIKKDRMMFGSLTHDLKSAAKKVFILSTAFSLQSFLDYLKNRKISLKLPKDSRLMETGGFKGKGKEISKSKLYDECEKRLGVNKAYCVSEYGMTELSSQFYDTTLRDKTLGVKRKPFMEGPAWVRTLVIDPRTGREAKKGYVGILRHFDLANRGAVLAIQTEDLGRQAGDGFELLGRATGSELRGCSLSYEKFLAATF